MNSNNKRKNAKVCIDFKKSNQQLHKHIKETILTNRNFSLKQIITLFVYKG